MFLTARRMESLDADRPASLSARSTSEYVRLPELSTSILAKAARRLATSAADSDDATISIACGRTGGG